MAEAPRGFFAGRRALDLNPGAADGRLLAYQNVSGIVGTLVSARLATLAELQSVYSVEDAYDMLEVLAVDNHNRSLLNADRH